MDRRDFLLLAAQTAAAAPTARIRAAIYGTQHSHAIGKLQAMLNNADYEVAGVCEPDSEARRQRQDERVWRDLKFLTEEQVLGDATIHLVVVECKVWQAIPRGRKVIAAGKHLHLEKPPAAGMAPFRELVEEARRKKLLLQMGYIWRFHQGFAAAIEAARNGWLGEVYMARWTINTDIAQPLREDNARYKGGILFELAGHMIDRVVDLWGRPKAVRTWLRHDTGVPDKLADNTLAVFEYDRSLAVISSAARMPNHSEHRVFELIGTDGAIVLQPVEPCTRMRISMREPRGPYRAGWQEVEFPPQPRYIRDFQELARALKSGQPLKFSYDHELLLHETLLRASSEQA